MCSVCIYVDINACSSNPCLSGGHCVDLKAGFRCECKQGYWGNRCEKEVDECALKPCLNGGKCLDKVGFHLSFKQEMLQTVQGRLCVNLRHVTHTETLIKRGIIPLINPN